MTPPTPAPRQQQRDVASEEVRRLICDLVEERNNKYGALSEVSRQLDLSYAKTYALYHGIETTLHPLIVERIARRTRVPLWVLHMTDSEFMRLGL